MSKTPLTINDIAEALNVSASTVSRALKDNPCINVNTRERIKQYAREHHFQPNKQAVELRAGSNQVIGVIIPSFVNYFFSSVLSGLDSVMSEHGYRMIVAQSNDDYEREVQIANTFLQLRLSGIIVSLGKNTKQYDHFKAFTEHEIPLVFFDRICTELNTDRVVVDDYAGTYAAVEHMIQTGCRNIYFYGSPPHLEISKNRRNGYLDAMHKYGITVTDDMMPFCDNRSDAISLTKKLLSLPRKPDGFFAVNDSTATGILYSCKLMGFKVPDDVSICGFAGENISEITDPLLTTVEQKGEEVGQYAFDMLLAQINGEEHPNKMVVRTKLLLRETTK